MRALLIFCEGRHDILFTQRSLGALGNHEFYKGSIKELPTPLGDDRVNYSGSRSFIVSHMGRHRIGESKLRTAAFPARPVFESILSDQSNDSLVVLLRNHGDSAARANVQLIQDLDLVLRSRSWDIHEFAVAFLFDADSSLDERIDEFRADYAPIVDPSSNGIGHARWSASSTGATAIGLYVFHDPARRTGTLDDELINLIRSQLPAKTQGTEVFIDRTREPSDRVSSSDARRLKAIITTTGQFSHPGSPMSELIGDRDLLPRELFAHNPVSRALVDFLKDAPWSRSS